MNEQNAKNREKKQNYKQKMKTDLKTKNDEIIIYQKCYNLLHNALTELNLNFNMSSSNCDISKEQILFSTSLILSFDPFEINQLNLKID